ncbi:MAG TPA: hypothetical protein VIW23_02940 [Candidatus Acidoferrum sp.]
MRRIAAAIWLVLILAGTGKCQEIVLGPAELCADIDFYVLTLKQVYVKPWTQISESDYEKRITETKAFIARHDLMTQREFWLVFSPLVFAIGDSHRWIVDYDHAAMVCQPSSCRYLRTIAIGISRLQSQVQTSQLDSQRRINVFFGQEEDLR